MLSRFGYMLMTDAEAALKDTRRVLRPGGRLALAAWADPADNPWTVLPVRELQERGLVEPVPPGPGQFAWAPEGTIEENLDAAGFVEYEVESLPFTVRYASVRDWWEHRQRHLAARAGAGEPRPGRGDRRRRSPSAHGPGPPKTARSQLPARTWVAAATA